MAEEIEDKKSDADAGEKLDMVLKAMDSFAKRMDALEAKKADEEEPKADEESEELCDDDEYEDDDEGTLEEEVKGDDDEEEGEPKEVAADKKRKDAEERKMEETAKADSEKIAKRIADIERRLPKQMSDADYAQMADAQAKADSVYQAFGDAAPRPLVGENLDAYRRRLATGMKTHSPKLKDVNLGTIKDPAAFDFMEGQIYADAMAAALKPVDLPAGQLREIKSRDTTGRQISTFVGEPRAWMGSHTGHRRRLAGINRDPR